MSSVIEIILNGLITGSIYALVGSGIALVYGTTRVLNFAHGELMMIAGYLVLFFAVTLELNVALASFLTLVLVGGAGALIQRATIAPLLARNDWAFQVIAATIGLSIALQSAAQLVWGEQFRTLPYFFSGVAVIGDIRMPWQRIAILVFAVLIMSLCAFVLYRTPLGRMVRATAQDAEAALAVGIPSGLVHTAVFAISAVLAGAGAILLSPLVTVNPWMGVAYLLKGFAVVILGGLGSFGGAVAAGFLLGMIESVGVAFAPTEWRDVIAFTFLIIVIWFRPNGLFAGREG
ncbi:branched-chain amino acid ABC transporter permease [Pseudooceanicola algae]|uniref:High-affinity branched-chain amino acid transport system permease protein LivH n=1 Tax=Pseudooceanicola algae TaxID=1537215 RepID=A0A418SJ11_9RHOB|nr:branched-chain amino acid ABC transporter permease [Pseudooceanicola algae]QPM91995.1 High-affinity branched-chain amino acid transport system permease protein LivH [Pseudooceanicola algae]